MSVNKIKISVQTDQLHKANVEKEEIARRQWYHMYGWMPDMYIKLHEDLNEISKLKPKPKRTYLSPDDKRTLKPFPETESGKYGWVASKSDFQLQCYGPDIINVIPLPKN